MARLRRRRSCHGTRGGLRSVVIVGAPNGNVQACHSRRQLRGAWISRHRLRQCKYGCKFIVRRSKFAGAVSVRGRKLACAGIELASGLDCTVHLTSTDFSQRLAS